MSTSLTAPQWVRPAARWIIPEASAKAVAKLETGLGVARLAAEVLVNRGYQDLEQARRVSLCPFEPAA